MVMIPFSKVLRRVRFSEKVEVTAPFFVYFVYFLFVLTAIFFDFFCKAVKIPQGSVVSRFVALFCIASLLYKFGNVFEFRKIQFARTRFLIGFVVVVVVSMVKIIYLDKSHDTLAYHLIAQKPGFINYFSDAQGFGKGDFQIWGFQFADKAFYYFCQLLGYRLGTVLNSITLFVCFIQILAVFDVLFKKETYETKLTIVADEACKCIFAVCIIMTHYILLNVGTYLSDAFALPFVLECLLLLFKDDSNGERHFYYFASLCGLCVALKLTNVVFVAPLIIVYIFKFRKLLNVYVFCICFFLVVLPSTPSLIYNYYITGNPVFPYYNKIFQSRYFPVMNYKDWRWGPIGKKQSILWLLNFVFHPENRISEIPSKWNFLFELGLVGFFSRFIIFAKKPLRKNVCFDNLDYLMFLTVTTALLWSFSTGYARYFEVGMVFLGIFAYCFFEMGKAFIRPLVLNSVKVICILLLIFQAKSTFDSFYDGREWAWRHCDMSSFKKECASLMQNRQFMKVDSAEPMTFFITSRLTSFVADYAFSHARVYLVPVVNGWWAKGLCDLKKNDDDVVYDIREKSFSPDAEYASFFSSFSLSLAETNFIKTPFGDYQLIKFVRKR